jgi:hypothetical protein
MNTPVKTGSQAYYQFLVDGQTMLDPHAMYLPLGARHEWVAFIALGWSH